jgi:acetyltransferase-like isoleucine patch superfamily enzyme
VQGAERRIAGDWYPGTIPAGVSLGESATIESSFSFSSYRSELDPGVSLGSGAAVYNGTIFDVGPRGRVVIGDRAMLVAVRIECESRIEIGPDCLLSWEVVLMDGYRWPLDPIRRQAELRRLLGAGAHACTPPALRASDAELPPPQPIRIGCNVWIGFGASVLPGVSIGDGAIVGARSVVVDDVPPASIVAGNPARFVRALA